MTKLELANGYYDLPAGKLVNVVTCLEMLVRPMQHTQALPAGYKLQRINASNLDLYREIFRAVGQDLMWFSRLIMPDENLATILDHPKVHSHILYDNDKAVGVMELDFREMPNCNLAFFGLVQDAVGTGLGRALMAQAIALAWDHPIDRLAVHTCHFDHPKAIQFYQKSGFKPYKLMIEVHDDPRQQGSLPRHASPNVAYIAPR